MTFPHPKFLLGRAAGFIPPEHLVLRSIQNLLLHKSFSERDFGINFAYFCGNQLANLVCWYIFDIIPRIA
jgi:hypothetical protein